MGRRAIAGVLLLAGCAAKPDAGLEAAITRLIACKSHATEARLEECMSERAYRAMHNSFVSARRPFDDAARARILDNVTTPDPASLFGKLVVGDTAGIVYRLDGGFLWFRLVREAGTWKVDALGEQYESAEAAAKRRGVADVIPADKAIDGRIRPAPPLVEEPDFVGLLEVHDASGWRVHVKVRGIAQSPVTSGSATFVIMGGLNQGDNPVDVIFEPLGAKPENTPRLVFSVRDGSRKVQVHELAATGELRSEYRFRVHVDAALAARPVGAGK